MIEKVILQINELYFLKLSPKENREVVTNNRNDRKTNSKDVDLNPTALTITLNVNHLNTQIKRQRS